MKCGDLDILAFIEHLPPITIITDCIPGVSDSKLGQVIVYNS
jgi:hypothetical protein